MTASTPDRALHSGAGHPDTGAVVSHEPASPSENANAAQWEDEDGSLTRLHPNYKLMMRVKAIIVGLVLIIAALIAEGTLADETGLPFGLILAPITIVALVIAFRLPVTRYNARGYQLGSDRLRVVRGVMWHSDAIVPFGRVQHIDVDQGPIERALDIATLTVHTAGNHNASVSLPGLGSERAADMRETIRAHIRRESM